MLAEEDMEETIVHIKRETIISVTSDGRIGIHETWFSHHKDPGGCITTEEATTLRDALTKAIRRSKCKLRNKHTPITG